MFRQILVHPDDRKYQRILWRYTPESEIQEYELTTVTYGTKPAPFLALATLRQLESEEGGRFPLVKGAISDGSYMDDIYIGAHSVEEGKSKVVQVQEMFQAGGFSLRKWISNSRELLEPIPEEYRETASSSSIDGDPIFRTLGLSWNTSTDSFCYTYNPYRETGAVTKRLVLARVAQLFDPLGWISPVIVRGKLFMQNLWRMKLNWDEPIPVELLEPWREFNSQLSNLSLIKIPRWLNLGPTTSRVQIHGFGDASDAAVGAVVYAVTINSLGVSKSNIIAAKSKLAPIKRESGDSKKIKIKVSTPRLELSAAVLLVKLVMEIQESLKLNSAEIHLWTDSSISYYWISGDSNRWKQFVRNRVVFIQESLPEATWHHVPGGDNPADVVSRGASSLNLSADKLWWEGPSWLLEGANTWPVLVNGDIDMSLTEEKTTTVTCHVGSVVNEEFLEKFSSLVKAVTVAAWWRRFYHSFSPNYEVNKTCWITAEERQQALLGLVAHTQKIYFKQEIRCLMRYAGTWAGWG